jgi:hypothetical protein
MRYVWSVSLLKSEGILSYESFGVRIVSMKNA